MNQPTKITCAKNGPYRLEGPIDLTDPTGALIQIAAGMRVALCRCGASANKPFCDGTHGKVGFNAEEKAKAP